MTEIQPIEKKICTVHTALLFIQQNINAPKDKRNTFGNYSYRSCEAILEAVKPLLQECDCIITLTDSIVNIGTRYYVQARAKITDSESRMIEVVALAREPDEQKGMAPAQLTGASSSYARKYALSGLLALDDAKDADSKGSKEKPAAVLTVAQMTDIKPILERITAIASPEEARVVQEELKKRVEPLPEAYKEFIRNAFKNKIAPWSKK